jgi:hypothetical protein
MSYVINKQATWAENLARISVDGYSFRYLILKIKDLQILSLKTQDLRGRGSTTALPPFLGVVACGNSQPPHRGFGTCYASRAPMDGYSSVAPCPTGLFPILVLAL